jgi:hypothetical protein
MTLPPELWLLVAKHLRGDRRTLLSLCRSHSLVLRILLPILYEQVEFRSPSSLVPFSNAVRTSPRQLGQHMRTLKIGNNVKPPKITTTLFPAALATELQSALMHLPNLRVLSLAAPGEVFHQCFDGLGLPFMLDKLEITYNDSQLFYAFLSSQSSITELHLGSEDGQESVRFITAHPELLPRLVKITASMKLLQAIVPGRSLSEIVVETTNAVRGASWPDFIASLQTHESLQMLKTLRFLQWNVVCSTLLVVTFNIYNNHFHRSLWITILSDQNR